jgi:hypothetical protein
LDCTYEKEQGNSRTVHGEQKAAPELVYSEKAVLAREDVQAAYNCSIGCTQASKQARLGQNQLFSWRKLEKKVGLTALTDSKSVVPLS